MARGLANLVDALDAAPGKREIEPAPPRWPAVSRLELVQGRRIDEAARTRERIFRERGARIQRAARCLAVNHVAEAIVERGIERGWRIGQVRERAAGEGQQS